MEKSQVRTKLHLLSMCSEYKNKLNFCMLLAICNIIFGPLICLR